MANATTTAHATDAGAHSAAPDIPGLFHTQHTPLFVRAHLLTFISTNAHASPVARIQHAPFTARFIATEHRKQRTCFVAASRIRKAAARGKLTPAPAGTADATSPGQNAAEAPFAARGTSVLSALRDYQAPEDTSLQSVRHGTSPFHEKLMGS